MSQTSGFFVSQNGDRVYTPDWLAKFVAALVTSGVYRSELGVTAMDGMAVSVAAGRAWIEGYLYYSDSAQTLVIGTADSALHRKDSIVLRLDLANRTISAMVLTGTPSANPTAPEISRETGLFDLKIAEVYVPAGTTKITQPLITDTRTDEAVCGITVSAVQYIPTADYMQSMEAEFRAWFEYVQGILGEDEAGNLLDLIEANAQSTADEFATVRKEMAEGDAAVHPISAGGTGADTAEGARDNLGITPDNIGAIAKMKLLATQKISGSSDTSKESAGITDLGDIPAAVTADIVGVYFTGTISGTGGAVYVGEGRSDGLSIGVGTYTKKFMGYAFNAAKNLRNDFVVAAGGTVNTYVGSSNDAGYPSYSCTVNGTLEYYGVYLA